MKTLLSPSSLTQPSNYIIQGASSDYPGSEVPGYSLNAEAWAKAERMSKEDYDWSEYENSQIPTVDHPVFRVATADYKEALEWSKVLDKLEPFPEVVGSRLSRHDATMESLQKFTKGKGTMMIPKEV